MANQWLRLWHDMPNDPKWRTIARISGQRISEVVAVYIHLISDASQNVTRGHVTVTAEDVASALDVTEDAVKAIFDAMQGRVLNGDMVSGWEKRQPKREDLGDPVSGAKSAAERKREQRAREKAERDISGISVGHEMSRNVTTDTDTDTDTDTEESTPYRPTEIKSEKKQAATPSGFAEFWVAYPKKVGKGAAERAWRKARINGHLPELLQAIERQKSSEQWRKDGGQYIPNPATWINEKRWDDDLPLASGHPARASPRMTARDAGRLAAARTIFGSEIEAHPHGSAAAGKIIDVTPATAGTVGLENLRRDAG